MNVFDAGRTFLTNLRLHKVVRAAKAAGFSFDLQSLEEHLNGFHGVIQFRCVCGRTEYPHFFIGERTLASVLHAASHYAQLFHDTGALSKEHLIEDGYSNEEAERINSVYTSTLERLG